jgi:osmoprotectant transport system permease protein
MNWERILDVIRTEGTTLTIQHLELTGISLGLAIAVALPAGILITRPPVNRWSVQILSFLNTAQGVPSLAVVAIFLPIMGIGRVPSLFALTIYALLPIARNTIAGVEGVDPDVLEAARGMGMSSQRVLLFIELPLALPVIIAGIQTSAVLTVGTATLAHLIAGGGLGRLVFSGISMHRPEYIIAGSLMTAALAILIDNMIGAIHRWISARFSG